jgi:NAD(P)-dependent dehydrogenase (short-subunit alcohol dehydrogenase family)
VVAGGAGSIGMATVSALSGRGLRVASLDRVRMPTGAAEMVVEDIVVDLLDDVAVGNALATLPHHGQLTDVICVAGGGDPEELAGPDPPTEDFNVFSRVVAGNLHTAFVTIRHSVPLLRAAAGDRSITLVGSINAHGGYGAPGYSAAKAGLSGLAGALAGYLGPDGIRINCLALGTVDTANMRALARLPGVDLDLGNCAAKAPLRRVLTPGDVAATLVAMALDMPGLTGTTVVLDSGQLLIR